MEQIAIVCSPGVGDALILHIAAYHLRKAGVDVSLSTPHFFGRWQPDYPLADLASCDAIFLQHDNRPETQKIYTLGKPVYTFYGSHVPDKHRPLQAGFDYVCDRNKTMVDNIVASLQALFSIAATKDNGLKPLPGLIHRRYKKRVAIHTTSGDPARNWPLPKFLQVADWLASEGYELAILPSFPSLEDLLSFIYESGYFLGNDSGPGHIASCLKIPHLVIGRTEGHMRFWRPGWAPGEVITPPAWLPNWKGLRLRETHWKSFINPKRVIKTFKNNVLCN
jgi:ADP-heptose:LPS heptosyltransferase